MAQRGRARRSPGDRDDDVLNPLATNFVDEEFFHTFDAVMAPGTVVMENVPDHARLREGQIDTARPAIRRQRTAM